MEDFISFFVIGFIAQLIDGALGMAYGLTATSLFLSMGMPPVNASATTHVAECVTTGFSALAHHQFGNVDRVLFRRLLIPGILGSVTGVVVLTQLDGELIKPFVACYLLVMGFIVLTKAFREFPPRTVTHHLIPLGYSGGLMDAIGGGGWGPIITSTLLVRGNDVRTTIGSVNACEFFITLTASFSFLISGTVIGWQTVLALALGGAIAAPLGAWVCKYLPIKKLMVLVGLLIITLSCRTLWLSIYG
jgi:uncharacterized membrane protein YfcA